MQLFYHTVYVEVEDSVDGAGSACILVKDVDRCQGGENRSNWQLLSGECS